MSVVAPGAVRLHGLAFDVAAVSEQGPRSENQDAFFVAEFPQTGVLAVADGMGGQRGGRTAAELTMRTLAAAGPLRSLDAARHAVRAADDAVARAAASDSGALAGMGCALALLALNTAPDGALGWVGAHVGDVRIISRAPDGTVRLETRDHTAAFARWEAGEIALDEIPDTPGANRLQRAVGHGGEADTIWLPVRPGWSYLLVSDGITKAMRLDELGDALTLGNAAATCEAVARKVEERGPDDNYTAVAVRVTEPADSNPTLPHPGPAPGAAHTGGPLFRSRRAMTTPRRSRTAMVAAVLSILGAAAAGVALWLALGERSTDAARAAEMARLRTDVDSLRARLPAPALDSAAAARADSAAPPVPLTSTPLPAAPAAPRDRGVRP